MVYSNLCLGCMEEKLAKNTCPNCGYDEGTEPESLLHLTSGIILQGKYMLGRVLGQGGFGITYLTWDMTLNIKLAIKEYLPQQLATRSAGQNTVTVYKSSLAEEFHYGLNKFLEEARTLARFNEHPNIVTVRDYFEANNTAYLVMNYHEGITLQSYLESKGGKIPVEQALAIFMPVLDALKEVHAAGILHRDISPDNLLIDKNGRVILIDFGAARQAMGEKSKSLSVILKAGYSPPEQYQSKGKQGPWTDIYAVAASLYRTITGVAPAEAFDRVMKDNLDNFSVIGIKINSQFEGVLLKGLAVNAEERFQTVEEFQTELVASPAPGQVREVYASVGARKPAEPVKAEFKTRKEGLKEKKQAEVSGGSDKTPGPAGWVPQVILSRNSSRKTYKILTIVVFCGLLIYGAASLFSGGDVVDSDTLYAIDYENGTIPIGDLPIGARVVDPSWEWKFRTGYYYSGSGAIKPVTWIIVAKDHYDGLEPHITLLSEELIALYPFDDSKGRGHQSDDHGYNHWGESGNAKANQGLRPWLNSSDKESEVGFYRTFSDSFKSAVLTTILPNKEWENGNFYSTDDKVFVPSSTELGDTKHSYTYNIGKVYPFFYEADAIKRVAKIGENPSWYWTRSPGSYAGYIVSIVTQDGEFNGNFANSGGYNAVRPALNLKSGILVSEIGD